jgi:hypothetical protein
MQIEGNTILITGAEANGNYNAFFQWFNDATTAARAQ